MTNDYDAHPRDLDDTRTVRVNNPGEAAEIRSRLTTSLHNSMTEAQNLANVYSNLARQLELQIVLVETKR